MVVNTNTIDGDRGGSGHGRILVPEGCNVLTAHLLDACYQVHRVMGPGLLEVVYERCVEWELRRRGLEVECQKPIDVRYGDLVLPAAFRVDVLIGDGQGHQIIGEFKCQSQMPPVFQAQLISYLRFLNLPVGLLVNFHNHYFKEGVSRLLNTSWKAGG